MGGLLAMNTEQNPRFLVVGTPRATPRETAPRDRPTSKWVIRVTLAARIIIAIVISSKIRGIVGTP